MSDDTAEAIRQQFVDIAESAIGLSAESATFAAYTEAIITSPVDLANPTRRLAMSKMSSCALRARRVMDQARVEHPVLEAPYIDQHAVSDVEIILRDKGASRGPNYRPKLGDFVIIDHEVHVFVVTEIDGNRYKTVQGGERTPAGAECIAVIWRTYYPGTHPTFDGRPVIDVGDCIALGRAEAGW